jgi:N-acetylglucosamine kinase
MILAFDIGGSKVKAARMGVVGLERLGSVDTQALDFTGFIGQLQRFAGGATAISISIAGIIDPVDGRIKVANIPCLNGRVLARDLSDAMGLPVIVRNDADCFALAEARLGAGRGARVVFGIILGTGVGGGIVIDGNIHPGSGGFSGEWGHGPVIGYPALPCGCGQVGCLDTIGGARGIERLHLALTGEVLASRDIVASRPETMARWQALMAGQLAMVVNLLAPQVIPVGGGLGNDAALIAALDRAVRARILRQTDGPLLRPAECGPDAGLIGAMEAGISAFGDLI